MTRKRPDLLARAYATLGLPPGSSRRDAARHYKALVRRWHPDRYADDPQGQAEAAQRMREINAAYALVRQHGPRNSSHTVSAESDVDAIVRPRSTYFGQRLSEADLQEIADAIGTPHYFAILMRLAYWGASLVFGTLAVLAAPRGQSPRPANVVAGLIVLCAAAAHLIYTLWDKKR